MKRVSRRSISVLLLGFFILSLGITLERIGSSRGVILIPEVAETYQTYNEKLQDKTFIWNIERASGVFAQSGIHSDDKIKVYVSYVNGTDIIRESYRKSWFNSSEIPVTSSTFYTDYLLVPRHWGKTAATRAEELIDYWYLHPKILQAYYGTSRPENNFVGIDLKSIGYFDIINHTANIAVDSVIYKDYLYVVYNNTGVRIINIENPNDLYESAHYLNESLGDLYGIAYSGNYVYLAAGDLGLTVIFAQNVLQPIFFRQLKSVSLYDLSVSLSSGLMFGAAKSAGLAIYDISSPSSPVLKSIYEPDSGDIIKVVSKDMYAFCINSKGGIEVVDASDKNNPSLKTTLDGSSVFDDLIISGNTLYAVSNRTVKSYDISNINSIGEGDSVSADETYGQFKAVNTDGTNAYIGTEDGYVYYMPLSAFTSGTFSVIGNITTGDAVSSIVYDSDESLVLVNSNNGGFFIIDSSDASDPEMSYHYSVQIAIITGITGQDYLNILWKARDIYGERYVEEKMDDIKEDVLEKGVNLLINTFANFTRYEEWFGSRYCELEKIKLQLDDENYEILIYSRNDGILLSQETSIFINNGTGPHEPLSGGFNLVIYDLGGYVLSVGMIHYVIWTAVGVSAVLVFLLTLARLISRREERLKDLDY